MWIPTCKCNPTELLVFLPWDSDNDQDQDANGLGVIVSFDGSISDRWGDGTAGVPQDIRDAAEDCEEAYCPTCSKEAVWEEQQDSVDVIRSGLWDYWPGELA